MSKAKQTSRQKRNQIDYDDNESDTSLDKYYNNKDDLSLSSSSSSSTTTSKSVSAAFKPKMFLKKSITAKAESDTAEEMKFRLSSDNNQPERVRRPPNPIAKIPETQASIVSDALGNTMPDRIRKDETPLSTMKFGSDTLEEEQEKAEFFRRFEQKNSGTNIDYGVLNQQLDLELSPVRNEAVLKSFDNKIGQMSTPLHHRPSDNITKDSITHALNQEIEESENHHFNATASLKRVTIADPPVRSINSVDDLSRTTKSVSDALTTTSDTAKDLNMLRKAYQQNIDPIPSGHKTQVNTSEPQKKKPSRATVLQPISKPVIQMPTKQESISSVANRPKTVPTPKQDEHISRDSKLIEQLQNDNDLLKRKIESLEQKHAEELRNVRQDNFNLRAEITQLKSSNEIKEIIPEKPREVSELEKLIDGYQIENEKLCKQIKQLEQQRKQMEKSMFEENEKLRQELIHTKMLLEQYENSHAELKKRQSSTVALTDLVNDENENEKLKSDINFLKNQFTSIANKQYKIDDSHTSRSMDQKRIKDLERQVKELELINLRHKQQSTTQVGIALNPLDYKNQLEIKLNKTEDELFEKKMSEEKLLNELNTLQEKYSLLREMCSKYEGQTSLNDQFEKRIHDTMNKNKTFAGSSILRRENERLKAELEKLKAQQTPKPAKSLKRDIEAIKLLRKDLERKNDELEKLRALYDAVTVQHKLLLADREREKTRLAIMGSKPYQPDKFTQPVSSIDALREENEQFKHLVEKLEHDSREQHAELMRLRDDQQKAISQALHEKDDEIAHLRQQHKSELQTLINEISSNTTETRISDLLRKIESQDATIAHLKKLTERADENSRELAILRVQDDELKSTVQHLEQELRDAQTYHTPEMKHFQDLQSKIEQLEQRWQKRDQIKKDYTTSLIKQHELDTSNDVNRLRAIIKQKNQEIERFHIELNSMLELLKTLKFQQLLYSQ